MENYINATCMDGTTAVYYRQTEMSESKKMLIYLEGGGFCVPRVPGFDCETRCVDEPHLCTARTDPFLDTESNKLSTNIWSSDPQENPTFHDFFKVFLPYSSSDVHSGTRGPSLLTHNFTFHGKYIVRGMTEDLIQNTWITSAEQVVLMGGSAGAIGTEANCDYFAGELKMINPDLDVRCISDSGSLYPYDVHTPFCYPQLLEYAAFQIWDSISDESCETANTGGTGANLPCISFGTSFMYADNPILILMSSEDTVIRTCYSEDLEFWDNWRRSLDLLARKIVADRPETGMYLANCAFHVSTNFQQAWDMMEVPVLDYNNQSTIILKDLIDNFVNNLRPIQAIDDMDIRNPNCNN